MVFVKGKNKRQGGNTLRILYIKYTKNKKLLFVQFQILNWRWKQDIVFTATDMNTDHVTWAFHYQQQHVGDEKPYFYRFIYLFARFFVFIKAIQ